MIKVSINNFVYFSSNNIVALNISQEDKFTLF
jgi:hypothetical protein